MKRRHLHSNKFVFTKPLQAFFGCCYCLAANVVVGSRMSESVDVLCCAVRAPSSILLHSANLFQCSSFILEFHMLLTVC